LHGRSSGKSNQRNKKAQTKVVCFIFALFCAIFVSSVHLGELASFMKPPISIDNGRSSKVSCTKAQIFFSTHNDGMVRFARFFAYSVFSFLTAFSHQVAESLYNQGFLSYPRTETDSFVAGTDLHGLIGIHTNDHNWGNYAQQ